MYIIDIDSAAEGITVKSADVILDDIFESGGLTAMIKLKAAREMFQINRAYHSAGELGISTAAYLHMAAATPSLPHALDSPSLSTACSTFFHPPVNLPQRPEGDRNSRIVVIGRNILRDNLAGCLAVLQTRHEPGQPGGMMA